MEKLKIAKRISDFTQPPIITVPLFLIICYVLSFENGVFDINKFITMEAISIVFASVLPILIIVFWAKKLNTDHDISNRQDRYMPLIVGIISYFIGFLTCIALDAGNFLTILFLCYSVNTGVVLVITSKWKISVHTTGLSGPVAALILLLGPVGAVFGILYPLVIWSRVLLKKHTLAQAICGGVQGFFLTVLEMYLFMILLSKPIYSMISFELSILYILAIILTPVLLGVLSYVPISNSRIVFYVVEILMLACFFVFAPLEVCGIFALISLTSIVVSYFAGEEFVWFRVLNS